MSTVTDGVITAILGPFTESDSVVAPKDSIEIMAVLTLLEETVKSTAASTQLVSKLLAA